MSFALKNERYAIEDYGMSDDEIARESAINGSVGVLHHGTGVLRYSIREDGRYKLIAEIDPDICRLARKLIPKAFDAHPQMYAPHISIVRHETPRHELWEAAKKKREGTIVHFDYPLYVWYDHVYFWLRCYSNQIQQVRNELGLPAHGALSRPPDAADCFHTSVANRKEQK